MVDYLTVGLVLGVVAIGFFSVIQMVKGVCISWELYLTRSHRPLFIRKVPFVIYMSTCLLLLYDLLRCIKYMAQHLS